MLIIIGMSDQKNLSHIDNKKTKYLIKMGKE